jgi:hypothetical protein
MPKRPENMTPEERLTRIRSLERKVSDLERDKGWAERDAESTRHWAEEAWKEVRRLSDVCSRHWNEKNEYRKAAGLEPEKAYTLLARYDHDTRQWIPEADLSDEDRETLGVPIGPD